MVLRAVCLVRWGSLGEPPGGTDYRADENSLGEPPGGTDHIQTHRTGPYPGPVCLFCVQSPAFNYKSPVPTHIWEIKTKIRKFQKLTMWSSCWCFERLGWRGLFCVWQTYGWRRGGLVHVWQTYRWHTRALSHMILTKIFRYKWNCLQLWVLCLTQALALRLHAH